ncbi:MAG: Kelch repeat-containing protein [Acidimicrobiia bacterium]
MSTHFRGPRRVAGWLTASLLILMACASSPRTDTRWEPRTSMEVARSEIPAAVVDGAIYLAGGLVSTAQGIGVTASVERYLPRADSWEDLSDLPEPRHHSMAASLDGLVYLLGGFNASGFNPVTTAWAFDPATGAWTTIAELPEPVGAGAAAVLDGLIYVAGGVPGGDQLFVYDPQTDTWAALSGMGQPREHTAAVAHDGRLWVMGGRWGGEMLASVEEFDPATATWSNGPAMDEARSGFGAAAFDGSVIVAGGEVFDPTRALDSVEILDGGAWRQGEPLPRRVHGVPLAIVDEVVYLLGGSMEAAGVDNTGEVWSLDMPFS